MDTHPLDESLFRGRLIVPQVQVAAFGAHSQSGGMSRVPLQAGDPAVEGAGGTVEMIGREWAHKRFLETLEETTNML